MTIQEIYAQFKKGIDSASESFSLMWQHPVLLAYYALLLGLYVTIYIVAYNFFCHHELAQASFMHVNSHTPQSHLLAEMLPENGGMLYIGYLTSIALNIFFRSLFGVALIVHTMALLAGKTGSIGASLKSAGATWLAILKWSLLTTAATFAFRIINLLPLPGGLGWHIITLLGLLWSLATFFVLPIIAKNRPAIPQAIAQSYALMLDKLLIIAGGMFWIGLLYILSLCLFGLIQLLPVGPMPLLMVLEEGFIFGLNMLVTTAVLIFKTKLYVG